MKTREITQAEFAARFGTQHIAPGSFSYFECDNGVGLIRDNSSSSIEVITTSNIEHAELSFEDELTLLALVCGDHREVVEIPSGELIVDYEKRDLSSRRKLSLIWIAIGLFLTGCLVIYLI